MSGNSLVDFEQNAPPGGSPPAPGAFSSGIPGYLPAYLSWLDTSGTAQQFVCFVKSEDYDIGADVTEHPVETGSNITDNVRIKLREAKVAFFETNAPIDSNNWANLSPTTSIVTVPAPSSAALPSPPSPLEFNAWNNLITEKALGATATGAIGNLLGGPLGGAVGTAVGEIAGDALVGGGVPSPQVVFPPPAALSSAAPAIPSTVVSQALGFGGILGGTQDFVQQTIALLQGLIESAQVVTLNAPKLTITSMVITNMHIHRDADTGDAADIEVSLKEIRFVQTATVPAPAPSLPRAKPNVNKGEQSTADAGSQQESVATGLLGKLGVHL